MKIKIALFALSLCGFVANSIADTVFSKNNAVSVTPHSSPFGYKISINQINPNSPRKLNDFERNGGILTPSKESINVQESGEPIWSFTTAQLPITDDVCLEANSATCVKELGDKYCYHHCLMGTPDIVTYDEKSNKLYFMQGTIMIGTGGGPAFLFVADLKKKEIKLLHEEWYQEQGSLSPSGRYLVIYGNSIIKLYDTRSYQRFELNKAENNYEESNNIRHGLYVKKWINNEQFIYIDIARKFVRPIPETGEPFSNAKEITYDIANRKIINERTMTEKDADDFEKSLVIQPN